MRMFYLNFLCLAFIRWLVGSTVHCEIIRYLEILENTPPGTRVGFIEAESPPYLIIPVPGSDVDSDLIIDQATGEIKTRVSLDREFRSLYNFVVLPQNFQVVVKVLDENDNTPSFSSRSVDVEFPENSPRDSKRALPPARDPDLGQFTTQRYDIVSGNIGDTFKLSPHRGRDGVLYVDLQNVRVLDREARAAYQLVIKAMDGGLPSLCSWLRVNVTVQDVNDNPPVFDKNRYSASVPENATVGSFVLAVNATDLDIGKNGHIKYSITMRQSEREEMFCIDPETGIVYVKKALDFESKDRYELVVVARDQGMQPLAASAFLSIYVSEINDNQPVIKLIFLSDDATPKINEDAPPGELVARILVSDPNSHIEYSNVTVSLKGGEEHFGLAIRNNVIYLIVMERPLDREKQPFYKLVIEATDKGIPPLRAIYAFDLTVTDVNDNPPKFINQNYDAKILEASEPGSFVLQVNAKDADEGVNANIVYSLINSTWFMIDENTGLITTASYVDCKANPVLFVVIIATDMGKPPLSSSALLKVTVLDFNNNAPIFEKPMYNVTVLENLHLERCFIKKVDRVCDAISFKRPNTRVVFFRSPNKIMYYDPRTEKYISWRLRYLDEAHSMLHILDGKTFNITGRGLYTIFHLPNPKVQVIINNNLCKMKFR